MEEYDIIITDTLKRMNQHKKEIACYKRQVNLARKGLRMWAGDHWPREILSALGKNPAITLNEIKTIVNLILGHMWMIKTDTKFIGYDNFDKWLAEMYTYVVKQIDNENNQAHLNIISFKEALMGGRSFFKPTINFYKDRQNGNVETFLGFGDEIFFDPFCRKYDHSDANYAYELLFMPKETAISMFPEKATYIKEIKQKDMENDLFTLAEDSGIYNDKSGLYLYDSKGERAYKDSNMVFVEIDYYYKVKKYQELFDYESNEILDITNINLKGEDLKQVMDNYKGNKLGNPEKYEIIKESKRIPYISIKIGDEIISDKISMHYPNIETIPLIPKTSLFTPSAKDMEYKYQGEIWNYFDPQMQVNKLISQIMHIVNKIGNNFMVVEKGAVDPKDRQELANNKNNPGYILYINDGYKLSQFGENPNIATFYNLLQSSKEYLQRTSLSLQSSITDKEASGKALALKEAQGLTSLQDPIQNDRSSSRSLSKMKLGIALQNYDDDRIIEIIGPDKIDNRGVQYLRDSYKNMRLNIEISENPSSPAARMYMAEQLISAVKDGIFPLELIQDKLAQTMDIPFSDEILQRVQNNGGSMPLQPK